MAECLRVGILYYFSSTANPILYNLMSRKFRAAFHRTVCCWCPCWRQGRPPTPIAPVPAAVDGSGRPRVPLRRPGCAMTPIDNVAADSRSANDGLLRKKQVLSSHDLVT